MFAGTITKKGAKALHPCSLVVRTVPTPAAMVVDTGALFWSARPTVINEGALP
jgi:hypothetical protein